jgi:hypothetical protein
MRQKITKMAASIAAVLLEGGDTNFKTTAPGKNYYQRSQG